MNFSKLSKEKKKHLAGVVAATVAILAALGFFLIQAGYQKLRNLDQKKLAAQEKLDQMQTTVSQAQKVAATHGETLQALGEQEVGMASGDLYSWMHTTLRKFQRDYKVEIPQISPISAPTDVTLFAKFPYQQASLAVAGTAYYHDLGRFIADFENAFPLIRIINLHLELNPTATERDKLAFRMELVTLVKP